MIKETCGSATGAQYNAHTFLSFSLRWPADSPSQNALVSTVVEDEPGLSIYMSEEILGCQALETCSCVHTGKLSDFFGGGDVWILFFIVYLSLFISLFVSFDGVVGMYCRR